MMTDEIESVREALANEKEERIKSQLDAQEVSTSLSVLTSSCSDIITLMLLQARSELSALQLKNSVLLEDMNKDDKLSTALTEIEELQKELTMEREQRAAKESSLAEEISQLQETEVAQENKSRLLTRHLCLHRGQVMWVNGQ